ncbi:MAG: response regulator [Sulfuricurvum sp.]|uniref:response regulator transcription factor n=1 Tax=Sulfuricurvum sp. TaxID=2025608 RepID=UPI0025F3612D|nr:response regulator transcription factor [Sulfuricurvum sp.]MCK9374344.1 response regulator [Sulfuricurvum sp.]
MNEMKMLSVLYAEDDTVLCEITAKTLKLLVDKVYSVTNGTDALRVYKNHHVDVVILDIYMGDISGIDVAKKIRLMNPHIPIIIVSGSIATEDLLAACTLNLVDYIQKPIALNGLINVLASSVDRLKLHGFLLVMINESVSYDFQSKVLIREGEKIALTKNEINAMELLIGRRGQIITRNTFSHILKEEMSDGALKNLILRLRKKMGDEHNIRNLPRIGYTLI